MSNHAHIQIVPGSTAPRYDDAEGLRLEGVVITEQATEAGLPIVDFVCKDQHGHAFVLTLTGRIVNGISGAVKGVNQRNHGKAEP